MVTVLVAVPNVTPPALRNVIVTVAVPALSPRICQATLCVPPAATVPVGCDEPVGLLSRSTLLGVKLTTTVVPLAAEVPPFVTVAVAVNDEPRTNVVGTPLGAIDMPEGGGGGGGVFACVTVKVADLVMLPANAVIVTGVFAVTADVVTVKFACVWPAGTLTIGGGWATAGFPVESVTDRPPLGAAEVRATVPVALLPPGTLAGEIASVASEGAVAAAARLTKADLVTPPAVASTSTVVKTLVGVVVIGKLDELLPAGTLTVGGTWRSAGLLLVNVTTPPPDGAELTSCTVPWVELPLTMSVGLTLNPASVGVVDPGRISSSLACGVALNPRLAWIRT